MELMLKPGWPGAFRRTIAEVCYVFEPGLVVDVPDAHAEELIAGGEVPRAIWPARTDSKGRAKHDLETLAVLFSNAGDDEDAEPDGDASPDPEGSDPPPTKPPAKSRRKPAKKPEPELTETGA